MEGLLFPELVLGTIAWESFEAVTVLVFFANFVTMCLPNKSKYFVVQKVLDILNFLAMNILSNANRLYPQRVASTKKKKKRNKRADRVAGTKP